MVRMCSRLIFHSERDWMDGCEPMLIVCDGRVLKLTLGNADFAREVDGRVTAPCNAEYILTYKVDGTSGTQW
jgi:hypothetical protein